MRVNSILTPASCGKYNPDKGVKSLPLNSCMQKCSEDIKVPFLPSFSGVIYFNPLKKQPSLYNIEAFADFNSSTTEEKPVEKAKIIPKEVASLFARANKVQKASAFVLEGFKDVYRYAANIVNKVSRDYSSIKTSSPEKCSGGVLEEVNDENIVVKKSLFDYEGKLKKVKDYNLNRIIVFDNEDRKAKGLKFTVYLDCTDIDNPDFINAKESYTFESGMLSRYTKNCRAETKTDWFIAQSAYTFNRNILKSYDKNLTVSMGTEYSSEYFEYSLHPSLDYSLAPYKAVPHRYVKGKVSINNLIRYFDDEVLFKYYGLKKDNN